MRRRHKGKKSRDGGEFARRGGEYWKSRLHRGGEYPGRLTKTLTHKKERRIARQAIQKESDE